MRKFIYGITGFFGSVILYLLLFVGIPETESSNSSLTDFKIEEKRVFEDLRSIHGTTTTIFANGTYQLTPNNIENYRENAVVTYGKANPMFYYVAKQFKSCEDVNKEHPEGIKKGEEGYSESLDKDKDGVACETESEEKPEVKSEVKPESQTGHVNEIKEVDVKEENANVKEENSNVKPESKGDVSSNGGDVAPPTSGGVLIIPKNETNLTGFNVTNSQFEEIYAGGKLFDFSITGQLPIDSEFNVVSSKFGFRNDPFTNTQAFHTGMDFSAPGIENANVYAVSHGEVVEVSPGKDGYGNYVMVEHSGGYKSLYAHLSSFGELKVGDQVKAGAVLGTVGSTGRSTGPHLHFEIRIGDLTVDPMEFIKQL